MKMLIGSRALAFWNFWYADKLIDYKTDWDVISDEPIEGTEWHSPDILNNREMLKYATSQTINFRGTVLNVCSMVGLKIIKRSHLWRSVGFQKHITMYHRYLDAVPMGSDDLEVLNHRTKLTHEQYPQKHPKLNTTVKDFFDDYVTKKYDHDWLHQVVAFNDVPMYTKMQKNPEMAWCSEDMWNQFSYLEKCQCVAEESLVIAMERFMIPQNWKFPSKFAFLKALDKVCTTLCSGWFRDFAIDHYPEIYGLYSDEKFKLVKALTESGDCVTIQE